MCTKLAGIAACGFYEMRKQGFYAMRKRPHKHTAPDPAHATVRSEPRTLLFCGCDRLYKL